MRLLLPLLLLSTASVAAPPSTSLVRAWKWTAAALVTGSSLDAASSYGQLEANPILARSNGRFTASSCTLKLGVTGAILLVEWSVARRNPSATRPFVFVNAAAAGLYTGAAIRNWRMK